MRCRSHKLQQLIELLLVIDFCRRANHPYEGHIKNDKIEHQNPHQKQTRLKEAFSVENLSKIKKILKLYENLT